MRETSDKGQRESLRTRAKAMHSEPTDAELRLWQILRGKRLSSHKFKRQIPIAISRTLFVSPTGSSSKPMDRSMRIASMIASAMPICKVRDFS